jgi:hypothetical protein
MVSALGERPGGGAGAARGGGAPQPEGGAADEGQDAGADDARAAPPGQLAPARLLGASSTQGRHWSFRRWGMWRRHLHLWRAVGRATASSPHSGRVRDG